MTYQTTSQDRALAQAQQVSRELRQQHPATEVGALKSEQVVVSAPFSFAGSATRLWKPTHHDGTRNPALQALIVVGLASVIFLAWTLILCWYLIFGILIVPYRLIRRSQRKNRRDEIRHREVLARMTPRQ